MFSGSNSDGATHFWEGKWDGGNIAYLPLSHLIRPFVPFNQKQLGKRYHRSDLPSQNGVGDHFVTPPRCQFAGASAKLSLRRNCRSKQTYNSNRNLIAEHFWMWSRFGEDSKLPNFPYLLTPLFPLLRCKSDYRLTLGSVDFAQKLKAPHEVVSN